MTEAAETSLEAIIRAAAKNGELTHLSVIPVAGDGPGGIVWAASFSPASKWGSGFGRDADPVAAIKQAMTDKRFAALTKKLRTTLESAEHPSERTLKALKSLPGEVDDSDFV